MSGLFAFRCFTPQFPRPTSTLVIFAGPSGFTANDVVTAIADQTKSNLAPEAVLLLVPDSLTKAVNFLTDDPGTLAALSSSSEIGLYSYSASGDITLAASIRGVPPQEFPREEIRRQGMTTLFTLRGGLIETGPTEHFVKPSKRCDTRFLRASHALSEGAEIFFVAFWLLPYLTSEAVTTVHVDSSSIASVALAAALMRRSGVPVIRTFQSYDGLEKHDFNPDRPELVLISASQSGSMSTELEKFVKDPKLIVTLFTTAGVADNQATILCDLRHDDVLNINGLKPNSRTVDVRNTRAIRLIGEHFTAEARPPRSIVPAKPDAPTVVLDVLSKLQGHTVFRTYRNSIRGEARAVWVDVDAVLKTDFFIQWLRNLVAQSIPLSTKAVVYFDEDPGSKKFVDAILEEAERQGEQISSEKVMKLSDIEQVGAVAAWAEPNATALVVGGVTGHGAELLAASRALRVYAPSSHRLFLTTAAIPSSKRASNLLGSNLRQPTHKFNAMFEIIIDKEAAVASWSDEFDLLNTEESLPGAVVERLGQLKATSVGLLENLFLPGATGPLKLRENFAFWPGVACAKASQADVFTAIASVLENLRSGEGVSADRRLANTVYDRSILSVETFSRYNDGVIQAAFLRGALPVELNYEDTPAESRLLTDLVLQMADLVDRPQGEALSEFLLAIALKRLTVQSKDKERLRAGLAGKKLTELQAWLAKKV